MPTVGTVQVKVAVDSRNVGTQLQSTARQFSQFGTNVTRATSGIDRLSFAFGGLSHASSALGHQSAALNTFARSAGVAASAAQSLAGLTALGGLSMLVSPAGILMIGLAALAVLVYRSGEAARKAKADLDAYAKSLQGVSANQIDLRRLGVREQIAGLAADQAKLPATLTEMRGGQGGVSRVQVANPAYAALGETIKGLRAELFELDIAFVEASKPEIADRIKRQTDAMADAWKKAGKEAEEYAKKLARIVNEMRYLPRLGVQFTPPAGPTQPLGPDPSSLVNIGGVSVRAPSAMTPPEVKVPEVVRLQAAMVDALKEVPAQIAANLAVFLSPIIARMGTGGAIGAAIGGPVGGAIGAGFGFARTGMGATIGSAFYGVVGSIAGTLIGGAIGSLFGGRKKAVDDQAEAMFKLTQTVKALNEQMREAVFGLPSGIKINLARFQSVVAVPGATDQTTGTTTSGTTSGTTGGTKPPTRRGNATITIGNISLPNVSNAREFVRDLAQFTESESARGGTPNFRLGFAGGPV